MGKSIFKTIEEREGHTLIDSAISNEKMNVINGGTGTPCDSAFTKKPPPTCDSTLLMPCTSAFLPPICGNTFLKKPDPPICALSNPKPCNLA